MKTSLVLRAAALAALLLARESSAEVPDFKARAGERLRAYYAGPPPDWDDAQMAGLRSGTRVDLLTWRQVYLLARLRAHEARTADRNALKSTFNALALEARAKELELTDFTPFRNAFLRGSVRPFHDPAAGTLDLLRRAQRAENGRRAVADVEILFTVANQLIVHAAVPLTKLEVDTMGSEFLHARSEWVKRSMEYREALDAWRVQLGLSPRLAVVPDRSSFAAFHDTFTRAYRWFGDPKRKLTDLPVIARGLATFEDLAIDGRFVLNSDIEHPERLAELLADAADLAIRHRRTTRAPVAGDPTDATLELGIRERIRRMNATHTSYEVERSDFVLLIRQNDGLIEQILAPVGAGLPRTGSVLLEAVEARRRLLVCQDRLVDLWTAYATDRAALLCETGRVNDSDWSSFVAHLNAEASDAEAPLPVVAPAVAPPPPPPPPIPAAPKTK